MYDNTGSRIDVVSIILLDGQNISFDVARISRPTLNSKGNHVQRGQQTIRSATAQKNDKTS